MVSIESFKTMTPEQLQEAEVSLHDHLQQISDARREKRKRAVENMTDEQLDEYEAKVYKALTALREYEK